MQRIAFCCRCRGMGVGLNRRYILHCVVCKEWTSKLLILTVFLSILFFAFPIPTAFVYSEQHPQPLTEFGIGALGAPTTMAAVDPAVRTLDGFLKRYDVDQDNRVRVAESIVSSSRKYNLDARLVASIMIIESRANPFAISGSDAIGIMQIHLPTWGRMALREGINLFKVEDNVDFGVRILKDYVRKFGVWEGVKRYKGWNSDSPESLESAENYLAKVQGIYSFEKPAAAELLQ